MGEKLSPPRHVQRYIAEDKKNNQEQFENLLILQKYIELAQIPNSQPSIQQTISQNFTFTYSPTKKIKM